MMDLIPPINKVFTLISQEKHQRSINTNTSANGNTNSMAFHVKDEAKKTIAGQTYNKCQRKERPIYTYYNYTSHAIEKCYQLHGYPPGYKGKQRFDPNQSDSSRQVAHATANQVSNSISKQALVMLENLCSP